jgi:hypothetical protein
MKDSCEVKGCPTKKGRNEQTVAPLLSGDVSRFAATGIASKFPLHPQGTGNPFPLAHIAMYAQIKGQGQGLRGFDREAEFALIHIPWRGAADPDDIAGYPAHAP